MTSPKSSSPRNGRTKMITAASIAAVGLASLFAIGANLGILARADERTVGTISATGDLATAGAAAAGVGLAQPTAPLSPTSAAIGGSQHFTVDVAGTVDASAGTDGVHIDLVAPNLGWTATPSTTTGAGVDVTFTNGTRTLEFTATVGADGTVVGDVTETPSPVTSEASDHHDSDHHDSDHKHDGSDDDD